MFGMTGYGRLLISVNMENFFTTRNCFFNLYHYVYAKTKEGTKNIPEKPKKPITTFLRFAQSIREDLKRKNPDQPFSFYQKSIVDAWASLDKATKEEYSRKYKEELAVYKKKLQEYESSLTLDQKLETIRDSKKGSSADLLKLKSKVLGKPKRPLNAWMLYLQSRRAEKPAGALTEWVKGVCKEWQNLPIEKKNIFEEQARKMLEKYRADLSVWEEKMRELGHDDVIKSSKPADTGIKEKQ